MSLTLICGCVSQSPSTASLVQSPVYQIPPRQLATDVKQIVSSPPTSLPVTDQGDGSLLTGWQEPFRGDFHVVRYWHERTRYHITIIPAFDDPAHRSRIQITAETEQRPDESGPNAESRKWHPAPQIHRPERSQAILEKIETRLEAPVATRAAQQ